MEGLKYKMNHYTYINNITGCKIYNCYADNITIADIMYDIMIGTHPTNDSKIAVIINFGERNG